MTVPLDRSGAVPGNVRIRAVRIPSRNAFRPPLVGLTGGPGQAGVPFASTYDYLLPTAGRDLVLLDQRGTGASGLLRCPSLERDSEGGFATAVGRCGRRLGARRSFYTSADSAEDIEALRVRLGVPQIALYAVSYGTRVAVEYARRYPQRVERMILDSAIGIGAPDPLGRDTLEAVRRVVTTICRIGCGGAEEHPVSDLARLVPRLRRAPIRRLVRRGSRRTTVRVGADDLLGLLVSSDQDPELMRRIPPAVRAALAGRSGPLVRLKLSLSGADDPADRISEFSPAVYVATTCEEAPLAWDSAASARTRRLQARAALAEAPTSAFAPFDRTAGLNFGLLPLCGAWPARERVVAAAPPLPATVATLVLAGDLDLRTPLENARRLARVLGGRVVVEHGVGHQVLGADFNGCGAPAIEAFLAHRPPPTCRRDATISVSSGSARVRSARVGFRDAVGDRADRLRR